MSVGQNKMLYILFHDNSVAVVDAETLAVVKVEQMKTFEPLTLVYTSITHELWIGDKQGNI